MDIQSYTRVGKDYIALDSQDNVVGVVKGIDSPIHQTEIERLKMAYRRAHNEPISNIPNT